jgi:microcystin-dependent protein
MGVSAFTLVAAGSDGKSIRNTISSADHGFVAGDVVRFQVTPGGGFEGWTAAVATSPFEAEVAGIVESATQNEFTIVYGGEISLEQFGDDFPVTGEDVYFLSADLPGKLDTNPPISGGHVIKPVLTRTSPNIGLVTNYVGTVIGGRATVSLDSIQPVGTIMPYAGDALLLPESWELCDGGLLDRATYSELYDKIGIRFGSDQTVTVDSVGSITTGWNVLQGSIIGTVVSVSGDTITIRPSAVNTDGTPTNSRITLSPITFSSGATTVVKVPTSSNVTAFNKPNISARTIIGSGTGSNIGTRVLGELGGVQNLLISPGDLPAGTVVQTTDGSLVIEQADQGDGNASFTAGQSQQTNLPPYISLYYIIKTSSYAKASYIDGLDLNLSMGGLTDVRDEVFVGGDILIYDGFTSTWKDSRVFGNWIDTPNFRFHGSWSGLSPFAGQGTSPLTGLNNALSLGSINAPFHINTVLSVSNGNIELRNGAKITDAKYSYDQSSGIPLPPNTIDLSYTAGVVGFDDSILIQSKQGIHHIVDTNDTYQFGTVGLDADDGIFTIGRGGFGNGISGTDYLEVFRVSANGRSGLLFNTDLIGSTTWYTNAIKTGMGISGGIMLRRGGVVDGITGDITNVNTNAATTSVTSGRYDIPTAYAVKKYVDDESVKIDTIIDDAYGAGSYTNKTFTAPSGTYQLNFYCYVANESGGGEIVVYDNNDNVIYRARIAKSGDNSDITANRQVIFYCPTNNFKVSVFRLNGGQSGQMSILHTSGMRLSRNRLT